MAIDSSGSSAEEHTINLWLFMKLSWSDLKLPPVNLYNIAKLESCKKEMKISKISSYKSKQDKLEELYTLRSR